MHFRTVLPLATLALAAFVNIALPDERGWIVTAGSVLVTCAVSAAAMILPFRESRRLIVNDGRREFFEALRVRRVRQDLA